MGDPPRRVEVQDDGQLLLTHPQGLRAIAHPARAHAIDRLFDGDPLTATELAAELGITPSAMSYHLRELAKWGIVVRDEATGDGRERPWRAAGRGLSLQPASVTPGNRVIARTWINRYVDKLVARVGRLADDLARDDGEHGPARGTASYSALWLTDEERGRLAEALDGVFRALEPSGRTPRNHPADARRYEAWTFVLPDEGAPGSPAAGPAPAASEPE